ncbi:Transcription factor mbp1, partial [Coemansia sp. RSA 2559]
MDGNNRNQVWSASYAGVEVFQLLHSGVAVMRRRKDSYINATQILKCAQYDKPRRTRFLEREIHTDVHEKVQGGYGKYQGTWIPLDRAVALAHQLGVYSALKNLFEYNPAAGEKPPTAPRSLESLNKRKSMDPVKGGAVTKPATKRRISKDALPSIQNSIQHQHNSLHRAGSLATILNSYGAEEDVPLSHSAPQAASPLSSSSPSPSLATALGNHPRYPPAYRNGNGSHELLYHTDQQPHTPAKQQTFAAAASDIPFTPSMASHYTHNPYLTPETPEDGRVLHNYSSASGRPAPRPGATPGTGANGSGGLALRDISNTYQATHYDDSAPLSRSKNMKKHPHMARPGYSMMTPPSSSSTGRRPGAGYNIGSQTTPRPQNQPDDGLLMLLRPPVPTNAHASKMPHPPSQQSRRLSGAQSWAGSPATSDRRSGGGGASSAEHSRTVSTASGASEPAAASMSHARFVEFIKRPRAPGSPLPTDFERFVQRDASLEPNSIVPNARGLADGKRYLHVASANAHWDVVRLLVSRGADTTMADCDGLTALMAAASVACAWKQREYRVFEALVDALAPSLACRDKRGRTAVHWACIPPGGAHSVDVWPAVSAYYVACLAHKLKAMGQACVLAWRDYLGYSAEQLARQYELGGAGMALAEAAGTGGSQSAASSPDRPRQQQPVQTRDRYDAAADRAEEIIRSSTTAMRIKHNAESRAADNDIEFAAQLLLELSSERDKQQANAQKHNGVADESEAADRAEISLKRKIEHVVGLQQSARA